MRWWRSIFRVHGTNGATELWEFGKTVQDGIVNSAIRLRYRLLPYTYSGFHRVMAEGYTMQRGLAFDFGADQVARKVANQFMYGPAFLVAPVHEDVEYKVVYLPDAAGGWFGFHDGKVLSPGSHNVSAPLLQLPLYVRAGSLVAMGPELQYTSEKAASTIELRLYVGADATMTLYEDDGVSADWSASIQIAINWDDEKQQMTFGTQSGEGFPGALSSRTFRIVRVRPGVGVGVAASPIADKIITYNGTQMVISL
jgi:alpha-D-xyloside xylohydrolase